MSRNLYQPEDDLDCSSSSQEPMNVPHGSANGTVTSSNRNNNEVPTFPANPVNDIFSSSESSSVQVQMSIAHGSGLPQENHAQAFDGENRVYGADNSRSRNSGPTVERLALFDDRQLDDFHLGTVSGEATKPLLKDLLRVVNLTQVERNDIDKAIDRRDAVSTLLLRWKLSGDQNKSVADLIHVLNQAGSGRYNHIICKLRNTPP